MAMADTNTTVWTDYVEGALDLAIGTYLKNEVMFRSMVDKRPERQAHPGETVTLTIGKQLAANTTALDESLDVTPVAMPAPRKVTITVAEYGNAVRYTNKLTKLAFSGTVAMDIGKEVSENLAESVDALYRTTLDAGTNKLWRHSGTGAFATADQTTNTDVMKATTIAAAVSLLKKRRAAKRDGAYYIAHIHPDVSYDLRLETGTTAWTNPHNYVDTAEIYTGEIGAFHGARFVENDRCTTVSSGVTQYNTYFFGREALAEAVAEEPHSVVALQIDNLKRFQSVGWYGILGSAIYRQNALQIVRTAASIAGLGGAVDYAA
jgi:N4-gp56 family major capsid protein